MTKFFKKSKKPYLEAILIIYYRAKNQKKLMSHSWEKRQTDGWADGWTDRLIENGDFIGPSVGEGSNYFK